MFRNNNNSVAEKFAYKNYISNKEKDNGKDDVAFGDACARLAFFNLKLILI